MLPPICNAIDFQTLGAKVRNTIDNVVTAIKVFTGLPLAQAREEIANNETALLGQVVSVKQRMPVREIVKQAFGRSGSVVKHFALQVVTRFVPPPVRAAVKAGWQSIGRSVVNKIKSVQGYKTCCNKRRDIICLGHACGNNYSIFTACIYRYRKFGLQPAC
jgi:hypothetical protein